MLSEQGSGELSEHQLTIPSLTCPWLWTSLQHKQTGREEAARAAAAGARDGRTHLLFLDWKRISSTEALREPDSSSFSTSLQHAHVPVMKHSHTPQHQQSALIL